MLIKLVQEGRTVDSADSIDKLDFSGLRGSSDWKVYILSGGRDACVVRVSWEPSAAYLAYTRVEGVAGPAHVIDGKDCIVSSVRDRLCRLFGAEGAALGLVFQHGLLVVVQPMG
ncbi:MAG: hypothetical protein ACYSTG_10500 [Planctomycetota bacterium]|jgi:hypothetical protein